MKQESRQGSPIARVATTMSTDGITKRKVSKSRFLSKGDEVTNGLPQLQDGWNLATIKEGGNRAKPETPKFLQLLYEILEVESPRVIRWSEDGLALQILDPVTVTEQILPKYFNHTNFHSFQRQLNYFGFRKWTKSKTDICTFSHPFFRENQPKLLLLIKRKKAPRRTPASTSSSTSAGTAAVNSISKQRSPCGKRNRPSNDTNAEVFCAQKTSIHIGTMNSTAVHTQSKLDEMPLSAMTTPHGSSSNEALSFSQHGSNRHCLSELNNVISPLAATECKKKAKKLDKKEHVSTTTICTPLPSSSDVFKSIINTSAEPSTCAPAFVPSGSVPAGSKSTSLCNSSYASSDSGYAPIVGLTSTPLPTLSIVRSRLIQRQQAGKSEQQQQPNVQQQQQQYDYNGIAGYSAPRNSLCTSVPAMKNRPEILVQSMAVAPVSRTELNSGESAGSSNSFSDPVNILLRIKKSQALSGASQDVGTEKERADDQHENLTSLHNYLLGTSLFTNRLQAQLKFISEENKALRYLLDAKQRELDALHGERKVLQQENAVLVEDKNKLFEINRDLLRKLFPQ
uniref:HSF-type DNA-binding domain-containing protein n=1 Tax=Hyaloperonospora arabidopsidis (strain Emoy2) TaxID=559515 RepID=M4BR21_HYAAE